MTPTLANEQELYFERGGPSYRLMQRIGLIRGEDPSVRRRIIAFLAITTHSDGKSRSGGRSLQFAPRRSAPLR